MYPPHEVWCKADNLYHSSMQFEDCRTALQYPLVHLTLCRCQQYGTFSMKALARYQVILLDEQRHIRCEQLAHGCCPNNAVVGVEPATSWSRVQRPTATPPSTYWCVLSSQSRSVCSQSQCSCDIVIIIMLYLVVYETFFCNCLSHWLVDYSCHWSAVHCS